MAQEIIQITSELFGEIIIPSGDFKDKSIKTPDVWESLGGYMDINVFDYGEGLQASIYPVANGVINTEHELEYIESDNIKIIQL